MTNETTDDRKMNLAQIRHMPLKDLAGLEIATLKDLQTKAIAAVVEAMDANCQEMLFNVQFAKCWIDCAIRFKKMK